MNTPFRSDGRLALVTGSSRGIGFGVAEALARAGARVLLHGRTDASAQSAAALLASNGVAVMPCAFDAAAADAGAALLALARVHGPLDILVNNAGINIRNPLAEATVEDWQQVMNFNLTACFTLSRAASSAMIERGWGRIINMASIMSFRARSGIAAYASSKHGLIGLTRALAIELGGHGVTVNAIAPGFVATEATAVHLANPAFNDMVIQRTPAARWGRPEDVGGAAVFLASREAAFVNGHALTVDGGLTAGI